MTRVRSCAKMRAVDPPEPRTLDSMSAALAELLNFTRRETVGPAVPGGDPTWSLIVPPFVGASAANAAAPPIASSTARIAATSAVLRLNTLRLPPSGAPSHRRAPERLAAAAPRGRAEKERWMEREG